MHIVFVTIELASKNSSSGGLASFTANMAKIFSQYGHHVSIILASTKEQNIEFSSDVDIYSLFVPLQKWKRIDYISKILGKLFSIENDSIRKTLVNLFKARQVKNAIQRINKKDKIDIIHYCNHGSLNLLSPKRFPYIVRISGYLNIWMGGANILNGSLKYIDNPLSPKDKLEEYTIKKSRYVVSPSNLIASITRENLGVTPVVIESPFILELKKWDHTIFEKFNLKGKKYIIHYGTLSYLKGIHIVEQIAKKFLCQHKNYHIVLSGNNCELYKENNSIVRADELVKRSAGEFSDRVIYAGRLVREQLYPLIQNAELCLLPSRIENLSNACIEAMAMGKIVVATDGASYEQLIDDGISGFLCQRDNSDSFLKAINKVLDMSVEEKEQMELKAIEVTKRLEPQSIYQQYLNLYKKVIREW